MPNLTSFKNSCTNSKKNMGVSKNSFEKSPIRIAERAQNTGCDLQCQKCQNLLYVFSKTEHAQKTPVRIANEGQCTGAVRISTAYPKMWEMPRNYRRSKERKKRAFTLEPGTTFPIKVRRLSALPQIS